LTKQHGLTLHRLNGSAASCRDILTGVSSPPDTLALRRVRLAGLLLGYYENAALRFQQEESNMWATRRAAWPAFRRLMW
jgi:hypothetical protein